ASSNVPTPHRRVPCDVLPRAAWTLIMPAQVPDLPALKYRYSRYSPLDPTRNLHGTKEWLWHTQTSLSPAPTFLQSTTTPPGRARWLSARARLSPSARTTTSLPIATKAPKCRIWEAHL